MHLPPSYARRLVAHLLLLGAIAAMMVAARYSGAPGYQGGGTLGFALRDTTIAEQLYRRAAGAERGVLWSAQFVSRWPLDEGQLDRWSAQAIGLLVDGLGPEVRLAGWQRLDATDIGDQRVAYRYTLAAPSGERVGEATIVVFVRGEQVGLTGSAAIGACSPIDALGLARALDAGAHSTQHHLRASKATVG